MVVYCVVKGCHNLQDKNKPVSFHTFPFKRPDILKLWISAIGREDWFPSKTSRICGEHFLSSDYHYLPDYRRKLLKPDAVPSVFNIPKDQGKSVTTTTDVVGTMDVSIHPDSVTSSTESEDSNMNFSLPSTSKTTPRAFAESKDSNIVPDFSSPSTSTAVPKSFVESAVQTSENYSEISRLRRKLKTLQQKIRRRDVQISTMKEMIKYSRLGKRFLQFR